jgi:hypothetical protein
VDTFASTATRSCPAHYGYALEAFRVQPVSVADTFYVIGGLYGNVEALHAILRMQENEAKRGAAPVLVYNGDHNWFDIDPQSFIEINQAALAGIAITGNVEAEIAEPSAGGCGCNYPDDVDPSLVQRSDAIMRRLQQSAEDFPVIREALAALPKLATVAVGGVRIGIVHGDAHSLAGWSFAADRLSVACDDAIGRIFRAAGVRAFASTHTCLPYARDFDVEGRQRLIMNNGAAGMANFTGTTHGVITRISIDPRVPGDSLYGIRLGAVRFDALPVRFDLARWVARFLANWPPGSPAHLSYFERIVGGPKFALSQAVGGRVECYAAA